MRIVLYNINSFGGNYEYSKYLYKAFSELNGEISNCFFILPRNADTAPSPQIKKILIPDLPRFRSQFLRKCHFVYRSFFNPLKFWFFLLKQPASNVVFNDFEQLSSIVWAPLFKLLKYKHKFAAVIHDPDRDNFFPSKWLSSLSIKSILWVLDVAFYHEILPDKPYYRGALPKVSIPHGIYYPVKSDDAFLKILKERKGKQFLMGILGNIRKDKNYGFVLECLKDMTDTRLLVAGRPVNDSVPLGDYKSYIQENKLEEKVIWEERYLTDGEFASSIEACDVVLLYYGRGSISQSGILNIIAPYKKKLLISDSPSPIKMLVDEFNLGVSAEFYNKKAFIEAIGLLKSEAYNNTKGWDSYLNYASWHNNVTTMINSFKRVSNEA